MKERHVFPFFLFVDAKSENQKRKGKYKKEEKVGGITSCHEKVGDISFDMHSFQLNTKGHT